MRHLVTSVVRAILIVALVVWLGRAATGAAAQPRPNIVVILADDLGFSDVGCYGSEIATPNLDRLAREGLRFTQFYNGARCNPTRASLLTGLHPHQAGVGGPLSNFPPAYTGVLSDNTVTITELLRDAGYSTLMSGKWHLGEKRPHWPVDRGFQHYFGPLGGAGSYWELLPGDKMALDDQPWEPDLDDRSYYLTDAITDHAIRWIEQASENKNPFFLYLAYTAPHWPLHARPEDIAKYRGEYLIGWDELRKQRHARQLELGIVERRWALSPREANIPDWEQLSDEEKDVHDLRMAVYAAMIDRMDHGIGRVLDMIERVGRTENTLVMFLSDNGGCHVMVNRGEPGIPPGPRGGFWGYDRHWANASNTPFRRFKQHAHEGGIATPLICYWPAGIRSPGRIVRQPGQVMDLASTFVELARAAHPVQPMEGRSLAPIFAGRAWSGHEVMYWEHKGNRAVRTGRWKLVADGGKSWELYDMESDRTELHNLADTMPKKAEHLKTLYNAWAKRIGVISFEEHIRRLTEHRSLSAKESVK